MAKPSIKSIQEKIWEQKLKIAVLEDEIRTQKYFETMPEYGPTYKYCYSTSNFKIPSADQSLDNWIKAVIKHMGTRRSGHGGAYTNAMLLSIPEFENDQSLDKWLNDTTDKIKKKATPRKRITNK